MRTIVIWGAGRIGRGFVAALFNDPAWRTVFVDIDRELVDQLNDRRQYTIFRATAEGISREIMKALPFLTLRVKAVKNRFFGETVTVAGLLCGADLVKAAKEENPEILFIPAVSLRHERDLFLDDYSLDRLQKEVGCPVYAIENGIPLLDTIEEICKGR